MILHLVVRDVPYGDLGAQTGAESLVKSYQLNGTSIADCFAVVTQNLLTDVGCTETLAFHGQISQFVHRIEDAKLPVEFQAINDHRRGCQADVLRPEVAMRIDDAPVPRPLFKKIALFRQKLLLCRRQDDPPAPWAKRTGCRATRSDCSEYPPRSDAGIRPG